MATIDLGKIKQVWRGTYSSSNSYTADDLVEYTDNGVTSTYIAVAASSNSNQQVPSTSGTVNSSYWAFVAKGVANPIPTQSSSTNGKALISDGTNASWGNAGAWTKIASGTGPSSSVTSIDLDNIFSATYKFYKIFLIFHQDDYLRYRWLKASDGSAEQGSGYNWVQVTSAENSDESVSRHGGYSEDKGMLTYWNATDGGAAITEMTIQDPFGTSAYSAFTATTTSNESSQFRVATTSNAYYGTDSYRGIKIFGHAGDAMSSSNFFYLVLGGNIS